MTESQGGSDLSRSSTVATRASSGWALTGEKWFCSAADSAIAVALARLGLGEAGGAAALPAGGGAGLVHHRQPQPVELDPGHLGQAGAG